MEVPVDYCQECGSKATRWVTYQSGNEEAYCFQHYSLRYSTAVIFPDEVDTLNDFDTLTE